MGIEESDAQYAGNGSSAGGTAVEFGLRRRAEEDLRNGHCRVGGSNGCLRCGKMGVGKQIVAAELVDGDGHAVAPRRAAVVGSG